MRERMSIVAIGAEMAIKRAINKIVFKTYSNVYGNKMVLFFFQYEIDFFTHISMF